MSHRRILAESISPFMLPETSRHSTRSMGLASSAGRGAAGFSAAGLSWAVAGTAATPAASATARNMRTAGSIGNPPHQARQWAGDGERAVHLLRRDCNNDGLRVL